MKFFWYLNFWGSSSTGDHLWFINYIRFHYPTAILDQELAEIVFVSVFGDKQHILDYRISHPQSRIVFYTGENLDRETYASYRDHSTWADLSLGFDIVSSIEGVNASRDDEYLSIRPVQHHYQRFPLWLCTLHLPPHFPIHSGESVRSHSLFEVPSEDDIRKKTSFCALIASHAGWGPRVTLLQLLQKYRKVDCPGAFGCNIPAIGHGPQKKVDFMKAYRFNLCPENSLKKGYVTEKLVHAFLAHTIPIYWGDPCPEEDIFNPAAYINVSRFNSLEDVLTYVIKLDNDVDAYYQMLMQPKLLPGGTERIIEYYNNFGESIALLLNDKCVTNPK